MLTMNRDSEFLRQLLQLNRREVIINLLVAIVNLLGAVLNARAFLHEGNLINKIIMVPNAFFAVYFLLLAKSLWVRNREIKEELKDTERQELIGTP